MIRAVTFTNYLGDSIRLDLARPEESGFIIKSVTGLGPGKANINTTEIATNDGSLFNSSRMPSRNIVISLAYMWKDSIEDVRQLSYKYFPIKKKLTMLIETDNRQAEIEGYVESNDPTIFSKDEGSDISIVCPNPFFYSAGKDGINTTIFYGVEALFEFPFSNESLQDPLLEMGEIKNETEQVVVYNGDAEIGVTITIHAIGEASNITIYKEELEDLLENICKIAAELGIHINRKKTRIVKISSKYKFLQIKYTLTDTGKVIKRINPDRVTAMRRKLKKLAVKVRNEEADYDNVENMFRGWMGGHYKLLSREQRKNLIQLYEDLFSKEIAIVNKKLIVSDRSA